jgi:hypothetical protein
MVATSGARGERNREGRESSREREKKEGKSNVTVLILVQRAAALILADGTEAAHRAAWPATRSCFCVLRKKMTRELGRAESGCYLLHAGVG